MTKSIYFTTSTETNNQMTPSFFRLYHHLKSLSLHVLSVPNKQWDSRDNDHIKSYIAGADAVMVMLDGMPLCTRSMMEIEYAHSINKPIFYYKLGGMLPSDNPNYLFLLAMNHAQKHGSLDFTQCFHRSFHDITSPNSPLGEWLGDYQELEKILELHSYLGKYSEFEVPGLKSLTAYLYNYSKCTLTPALREEYQNTILMIASKKVLSENVYTFLHRIADLDNTAIARDLMMAGVDINASCFGKTPLSIALGSQSYGVAKLLIDAGAKLDLKIQPNLYSNQISARALENFDELYPEHSAKMFASPDRVTPINILHSYRAASSSSVSLNVETKLDSIESEIAQKFSY